jgi:hypothetical protein
MDFHSELELLYGALSVGVDLTRRQTMLLKYVFNRGHIHPIIKNFARPVASYPQGDSAVKPIVNVSSGMPGYSVKPPGDSFLSLLTGKQ